MLLIALHQEQRMKEQTQHLCFWSCFMGLDLFFQKRGQRHSNSRNSREAIAFLPWSNAAHQAHAMRPTRPAVTMPAAMIEQSETERQIYDDTGLRVCDWVQASNDLVGVSQ